MNVYHVMRMDRMGPREYLEFVCVAPDAQTAQHMHPAWRASIDELWASITWCVVRGCWKYPAGAMATAHGWKTHPDHIRVTLLGQAAPAQDAPRVVCASWHDE